MSIRILPLTLLCCALLVAFVAVCCFVTEKRFAANAIRTWGRIVTYLPFGENGALSPVVEFVDKDGVKQSRQANRAGTWNAQAGDEVSILYTKRKVLGMDAWNIFVAADEDARPYRSYTIAGVILSVIAVGLAAAGIIIWLR